MPLLHLRGDVHVADIDDLYEDLGYAMMRVAVDAVKERDYFHLAVSGGSTPEPFYMRLVTEPPFRNLPWKRMHLWIVDERRVPDDDEKSNFRMIRESLSDHVPTPRHYIHPMPVLETDAADAYEQEMRQFMRHEGAAPPRLDFVLLGMGADGHTASLFPGSAALQESKRWIAVNEGPTVVPPTRLTMTYPLLNAARNVAVLVTGAGKASTLLEVDAHLRSGNPDPAPLPITGVDPTARGGEMTWFLDEDAAGA
ncbi:MAG: 6-phosphogluconolactonase [Phycisphaeraceae bacterium]|nr:6-phosphogluconolactonase [Phycisphaeraceae bacterium]